MSPRRVLVVDAANVVGSRPDGWWRDRPGAAARLHDRLVAVDPVADLDAERVVVVLEGRARAGVPEGATGAVEVVHAPGEGDDELVRQAGAAGRDRVPVRVVTADRGLAGRVMEVGATVEGPRWLLERLDRPARGARPTRPD